MEKYCLSPEEHRALQLKTLEMADYFQDFCKKHDLLCYLCGGGCIGAVRHGGFIPWDDDLDFFMPRSDYEKLGELWNRDADTEKYAYQISSPAHFTRNQFATIHDNHTTFIKPYQADLDMNHGVMLDILPLDGCPSSFWKRKAQIFWALAYSLFCIQQPPEHHGALVTFFGRFLLALFPGEKRRQRMWKHAEQKMSQYKIADCERITELCSGPHYMMNEYPKSAFASAVYREFEGRLMPIPVGYDPYLRMAFGDYMQLPPEEKRIPHHDVVYCDLENSYLTYKGIYYCKEEKA